MKLHCTPMQESCLPLIWADYASTVYVPKAQASVEAMKVLPLIAISAMTTDSLVRCEQASLIFSTTAPWLALALLCCESYSKEEARCQQCCCCRLHHFCSLSQDAQLLPLLPKITTWISSRIIRDCTLQSFLVLEWKLLWDQNRGHVRCHSCP